MPTALSNSAGTLDSKSFGIPVANWPGTGCSIQQFFQPQQPVFDITLCGEWAGGNATFATNCTGTRYNDYVTGGGGEKVLYELGSAACSGKYFVCVNRDVPSR